MAQILVVDDEPANRLLLRTILTFAGHHVVEAQDGDDGLRAAADSLPDLVIMDLSMPGMNGTEFVKNLRAHPRAGGVRVALYTGTQVDSLMEGFMEMYGIRHVMPKPSDPQEVLRIVGVALET